MPALSYFNPRARVFTAYLAAGLACRWPSVNAAHLAAWVGAVVSASRRHKAALERQCSVPLSEKAQDRMVRRRLGDERAAGERLAAILGVDAGRVKVAFGLGGGWLTIDPAAGDPVRSVDISLPL